MRHAPGELLVILPVEGEPARPSPVAAHERHRTALLDRERRYVDLVRQLGVGHDRQIEALLLAEVRSRMA